MQNYKTDHIAYGLQVHRQTALKRIELYNCGLYVHWYCLELNKLYMKIKMVFF